MVLAPLNVVGLPTISDSVLGVPMMLAPTVRSKNHQRPVVKSMVSVYQVPSERWLMPGGWLPGS